MSPTRNRLPVVASIVIALLAAVGSACTDSPPPNPTTLSGIAISDAELIVVESGAVTVTVALDSPPGEGIEVQFGTGADGADDIEFVPDRVTWTPSDWQRPRNVSVVAVADRVTEGKETHEIYVRTYRASMTRQGHHILPRRTIRAVIVDRPELVVLAGGGAGEIVLEWTPGGERGHPALAIPPEGTGFDMG